MSGAGLIFNNVHNLKIANMNFSRCTTREMEGYWNVDINTTLYKSVIYIVNSTNVSFIGTNITRSPGNGLVFLDTDGSIEVLYSTLSYNGNESGGVYIEFSGCSSETSTNCTKLSSVTNISYRFVFLIIIMPH